MKIQELKNKKILIVGAGKEGEATFKFLRHFLPEEVIDIVDKKDNANYLQMIRDYNIVIKSPGISPNIIGVPYTTAVNIFFANVLGKTIGVTGTKGKSTTASLIYAILRQGGLSAHLVGNIGTPMLGELLQNNKPDDVWVCELSSYMTGDLEYTPDISLILNLFPEHMDYHGSVEAYYAAKENILSHADSKKHLVYNPEVIEVVALTKRTSATIVPFVSVLPFEKNAIHLLGEHNVAHVRAAVTVGGMFGISNKDCKSAVENFLPLRHRLQNVGTFKGITFYDDAISTAPQSAIKAIETLKNIGTMFLGGQNRGYDFSELAKVILKYKIPNLVLFPQSGADILQELKKISKKLPNIFQIDNHKDAIEFAYSHTKPGEICLMSPASPSYSLWKNFEERGDEFQTMVKKYGMSEINSKSQETIYK